MAEDLQSVTFETDAVFIRLARELAMDIQPLEDILKAQGIDAKRWEVIQNHARFKALLASEVEAWNSATNTAERVRLKSLSFVEEALPEFYGRAHDAREPLSAKVELLKTVAKFAGVDRTQMDGAVAGERFSVTINMGADKQLKIEKDVTPRVTIDATAKELE
jgi:hypothetical protein